MSTHPALHVRGQMWARQHRVKFCAMLSRGRCRRMRWYPSCAPCAAPPSPARCRPPPARLAAAFSGARLADLRAGTPRQRRFRDGAPFRAGCSSARPEGCRSLSFVRNRVGRSPESVHPARPSRTAARGRAPSPGESLCRLQRRSQPRPAEQDEATARMASSQRPSLPAPPRPWSLHLTAAFTVPGRQVCVPQGSTAALLCRWLRG